MINLKDINIDDINFTYETFKVPKKTWWQRIILSPNESLKKLQKQIKDIIEKEYFDIIPDYITWFRKGLSIKDNASFHINKKLVINIDVSNFFNSIDINKIVDFFKDKVDDINKFIKITTYNWILPTWSPCSPIIWNLVFLKIDEKINSYLNRKYNNFWYSRYVDDITFSFKSDIDVEKLLENIKFILFNNWFEINQDKIKIYTSKMQQTVTWLVVNEKISYPRYNYRIIRSKIHKYIVEWIWYFPKIKWYLNYLSFIDNNKFLTLKNYYSKYKDNTNYINLFIWTCRPIVNKKSEYSFTWRSSRRWSCKTIEYEDIEYNITKKYKI